MNGLCTTLRKTPRDCGGALTICVLRSVSWYRLRSSLSSMSPQSCFRGKTPDGAQSHRHMLPPHEHVLQYFPFKLSSLSLSLVRFNVPLRSTMEEESRGKRETERDVFTQNGFGHRKCINWTCATPLLSFHTAHTSANMQPDDYWGLCSQLPQNHNPCQAFQSNSPYVNVVLPCRRHAASLCVCTS